MAKKRKPKKKAPQNNYAFYIGGIVFLILVLSIAIFSDSKSLLEKQLVTYLEGNEIALSGVGPVLNVTIETQDQNKFQAKVVGQVGSTTITGNIITLDDKQYLQPKLKITGTKKEQLSPFYVDKISLKSGSENNTTLAEATEFTDSQDIVLQFNVDSLDASHKSHPVTQGVTIRDQNGTVILNNPRVARYSGKTDQTQSAIGFTNRFADLAPGKYTAVFSFRDEQTGLTSQKSLPLSVVADSKQLVVDKITYLTPEGSPAAAQGEFNAGNAIAWRMDLSGFKVRDNEVSGKIGLQITNSLGEIIAQKPSFASFKKEHQKQNKIAVHGKIVLKEPDVYFLNFKIADKNSTRETTHQEKIVVRFWLNLNLALSRI